MSEVYRPKILLVHNYYQLPGGEDTVVANEKRLLEENGHKVVLYTRNNNEIKKMKPIRKIVLPLVALFNLKTYYEVKKIIKEQKIEIVHVHNTLTLISPAVYYAAVNCNVPIVQTVHNFRFLCPGATFYREGHICEDCTKRGLLCAIKHDCYRKSKTQTFFCAFNTWVHRHTGIYNKLYYICLTEFTKKKLTNLSCFKTERIFIKPNFTIEGNGIKTLNEDYFLYVGRIEEIKGIDLLVDAFKKMSQFNLYIIGTGDKEKTIKNRIEKERLHNIKLLGYIPHDEIYGYMKNAKALVMCSQWYETFGMVIVEAYSCKIPVIVGRIGNIKDLVDEGKTGYTFKYNDVGSLIKAVNKMSRSNVVEMGENAYEVYKKSYNKQANYSKLIDIYHTVMKDNALRGKR